MTEEAKNIIDLDISGCERLAIGIVKQAADDYRAAIKKRNAAQKKRDEYKPVNDQYHRYNLEYRSACNTIKTIERFLLSDRGQLLSFGTGKTIIDQLRKEARQNDAKEKIYRRVDC